MKKCFRCEVEKPLSDFYRHPGMADGHLNKCKSCARADVIANRNSNIEHYRSFDRERAKTEHRKAAFAEKNKRKRAVAGPAYDRAHNAVQRAVASGRMIKPSSCSRCPATEKIAAHHDDHDRPLDVMWLCPVCHAARHKELGRLRTVASIYDSTPNAY